MIQTHETLRTEDAHRREIAHGRIRPRARPPGSPPRGGESRRPAAPAHPTAPRAPARTAYLLAALLGSVHAAWSLYWAFGGQALLDTVGRWAAQAADDPTPLAIVGLLTVGVFKLMAAWTPLWAETGRLPGRRLWRAVSWVAGPVLVLYGGANTVLGSLSLLGRSGATISDRQALLGHAFLWGPLFALWGIALTAALVLSRAAADQLEQEHEPAPVEPAAPGDVASCARVGTCTSSR